MSIGSFGVAIGKIGPGRMTEPSITTVFPLDQSIKTTSRCTIYVLLLTAALIIISIFMVFDRYSQLKRVAQLESDYNMMSLKIYQQDKMMLELRVTVQSLRWILQKEDQLNLNKGRYEATEARSELIDRNVIYQMAERKITGNHGDDFFHDSGMQSPSNAKSNFPVRTKRDPSVNQQTTQESEGTHRTSSTRKKKNRRADRRTTNQCNCGETNSEEASHVLPNIRRHLVAHFETGFHSNQVVDAIVGNWSPANWMTQTSLHNFHLKTHLDDELLAPRPRRSTVIVRERGIYYIYSQMTYSDQSSILGHSIMVNNVAKFTCTLCVSDIQANTCVTGGLVLLESHSRVHIQLMERNRVIHMHTAHTFFGMIQMASLVETTGTPDTTNISRETVEGGSK